MNGVAIVFAGGSGVRMGSAVPKQFLELDGKPVLAHTLELFERHPRIDGIYLVASAEYVDAAKALAERFGVSKLRGVTAGGASAQESIYNGLRALSDFAPEDSIVLVHDGVRPFVTDTLISDCIKSVKKNGSDMTITLTPEVFFDNSTYSHVYEYGRQCG